MGRFGKREANDVLDAELDCVQIVRTLTIYEFPWDMNQSLSMALFRTYAVPSIGRLLDRTGEFTGACQKRYDDTALLLEAPSVHGFDHPEARSAIRRINQMHHRYDIAEDDMRYVLATFVVVPKRWLDDFGWRPLTEHEVSATVHYYRQLGRHMGIVDVPTDFAGFERLMDDYERDHFAFDEGGRRVADSTLTLMTGFFPSLASRAVDVFSRALMEPHLLAAFHYDEPGPRARAAARGALKARARLLRLSPPRRRPSYVADSPRIKGYPPGFDVARLGTFDPGSANARSSVCSASVASDGSRS